MSSINVSWIPPRNGSYHNFVVSTHGREKTTDNNTRSVVLVGLTPGTLYTINIKVVYFNVSSELVVIEDIGTCEYLRSNYVF